MNPKAIMLKILLLINKNGFIKKVFVTSFWEQEKDKTLNINVSGLNLC